MRCFFIAVWTAPDGNAALWGATVPQRQKEPPCRDNGDGEFVRYSASAEGRPRLQH